jgi:hypothetical protein
VPEAIVPVLVIELPAPPANTPVPEPTMVPPLVSVSVPAPLLMPFPLRADDQGAAMLVTVSAWAFWLKRPNEPRTVPLLISVVACDLRCRA